jgi:hypothetical protein
MKKFSWFGALWLTRFSKPAGERPIYRLIRGQTPKRILELGLGTLERTARVLSFARSSGGDQVHYVGLDRFEGRLPSDPPGVTLKAAHQRLTSLGRVQLVPGNVDTSLARLCNHLGVFDLVLLMLGVNVWLGVSDPVGVPVPVSVVVTDGVAVPEGDRVAAPEGVPVRLALPELDSVGLGVPLDEHIGVVLAAMQADAAALGLAGVQASPAAAVAVAPSTGPEPDA